MRTYDKQMLKLIDILKNRGEMRFDTDFCRLIDIRKQDLISIKKGKRHFSIKNIIDATQLYNVNLYWIFGLSDDIFLTKEMMIILRSVRVGDKSSELIS